jgi:hypothetical protein
MSELKRSKLRCNYWKENKIYLISNVTNNGDWAP